MSDEKKTETVETKPEENLEAQKPQQVIQPAPEEKPEEIKVEGENIIIGGEAYDPERALNLIKKLRPYEKEVGKLSKKVEDFEKAEQQRQEAEMTEMDKAKLRAEEAESKLKALELKEMRRSAADKAGIPLEFADRLQGETQEALDEDAKNFAEKLPKKSGAKIASTMPSEGTQKPKTDYERLQEIRGGHVPNIFSTENLEGRGGGVAYSQGKQSGVVDQSLPNQ